MNGLTPEDLEFLSDILVDTKCIEDTIKISKAYKYTTTYYEGKQYVIHKDDLKVLNAKLKPNY